MKATDVTISKAANLATLVQRPQASDLVWSIYTAHKAGKKDWGSPDTQMDVLRAVCAAPPDGSEGEVRITSLLESCMAEESGGAGQGGDKIGSGEEGQRGGLGECGGDVEATWVQNKHADAELSVCASDDFWRR